MTSLAPGCVPLDQVHGPVDRRTRSFPLPPMEALGGKLLRLDFLSGFPGKGAGWLQSILYILVEPTPPDSFTTISFSTSQDCCAFPIHSHQIRPDTELSVDLAPPTWATRRAMIVPKSPPVLIAACAFITLVTFFSLWSRREVEATPSEWSFPGVASPASVRLSNGNSNYDSATSGKKAIDTTSEIGRASNATLGVSSPCHLYLLYVFYGEG